MARRNKKAADLAAAKQAKQKKIAIAGFVVFLAVMAFSVPKTLKMLKGPQPVAEATQTTPTPAPTPPTTPGTPAPAATPAPEASSVELIDTGGVPDPSEGQFISFERFASKDPFAQQVDATPEAPAAAAPTATTPEEGEEPGVPDDASAVPTAPETPSAPAPTQPSAPTTKPPAPEKPAPAEKPKSAVISINGTKETVEAGATFPKEEEIFELLSLTATSAKIGIAGGSLTGGAPSLTLEKGKKVTLQNTADGTQYELTLVSLG